MRTQGFLFDSRIVTVEEQITIFLFTLSHNERNRIVQNRFQHSGERISRYFNKVLNATLKLCKYYVKPAPRETPQQISSNPLFYPWFKNCVGVIDGTHIPARVRVEDQVRYRNRKGFLSQNVMAVVDFDMQFQYIFAGWEGSASDSRVLRDAIWRRQHNRLRVPIGKYFLVDVGYANTRGFLAPFRGVRYHLKEWHQSNDPRTPHELFNLRHSKFRNVVERTFAVLKQRFPILTNISKYDTKQQAQIVIACCALHNFIRLYNWEDEIFLEHMGEESESDSDNSDSDSDDDEVGGVAGPTANDKQYMVQLRENIAQQMWDARAIR